MLGRLNVPVAGQRRDRRGERRCRRGADGRRACRMFVRRRVTFARGTLRFRRRLDRFEGTVRATEVWILLRLLLLLLLLLLTVMIQEDAGRNLSMALG